MMFHSLYLVPVANATAWQGYLARIAFRAVSPSTIMAMNSATAIVAPIFIAGMVGYVVYKSDAITALKNWWNSSPGADQYPVPATEFATPTRGAGTTASVEYMSGAWRVRTWTAAHANSGNYADWWTSLAGYGCAPYSGNSSSNAWLCVQAMAGGSGVVTHPSPPVTPTDYSTDLSTSQPSFPSQSVYASPGMVANMTGAEAAGVATQMSDADAQAFANAAGLTAVDTAGQTQDGFHDATPADNGATGSFPAAAMALLDAIRANTGSSAQTLEQIRQQGLENTATFPVAAQNALDNIAVGTLGVSNKLDNVIGGINAQTTAIEDISTKVEHLDNTITQSTATSSTVQSRIDALKTAASTKFPFSLASSLTVAPISGTSTYEFTSLPLTSAISIPIQPMMGPLHTLFDWIRQLLVWFFWAGTLFAILRKGMEM